MGGQLTTITYVSVLSTLNKSNNNYPSLHSGETGYNINKWCFWLLNILNLLTATNQKRLQIS